MALVLKATSYKGGSLAQDISARFDETGGTIGRSPDNHLVLPDPDKFVSRLHARIVFENGQYFLQDSSTGGTYLVNSDMPLQQTRVALKQGDRLRIGEYELQVDVIETPVINLSPIVEPVRQLELSDSALLDGPFAPAAKTGPDEDFFGSFIEQAESSPIHQNFTPPQIAIPPAAATIDDLDFGDLLSSLDALPKVGNYQQTAVDLPTLPEDFFADEGEPFPTPVPATVTESESAPGDLFEPMPHAAVRVEDVQAEAEIEASPPFAMPSPGAKAAVAPAPAVSPSGSDSALLREFLAGAGITDGSLLPPEQWPVLMRTSGELLRGMVDGLMRVLRARAELKSQFRVSVTTMRSIDNNPLKFTPSVDDAMRLMLAPTNPGFLPPKQAVSEGFSDIMNHQIAMTAGIQAALAEILHGFDPQVIEKTQVEGVLFQKKAKCWDAYIDRYPQLKTAAQEEFFGDAFADAYEKQMLLLSRASKNQ